MTRKGDNYFYANILSSFQIRNRPSLYTKP